MIIFSRCLSNKTTEHLECGRLWRICVLDKVNAGNTSWVNSSQQHCRCFPQRHQYNNHLFPRAQTRFIVPWIGFLCSPRPQLWWLGWHHSMRGSTRRGSRAHSPAWPAWSVMAIRMIRIAPAAAMVTWLALFAARFNKARDYEFNFTSAARVYFLHPDLRKMLYWYSLASS